MARRKVEVMLEVAFTESGSVLGDVNQINIVFCCF